MEEEYASWDIVDIHRDNMVGHSKRHYYWVVPYCNSFQVVEVGDELEMEGTCSDLEARNYQQEV